ncbi:MAG: AbrB/MazE/SpoVT family DNA-binding domain-containing protein [Candidatus Woesearchaeota archaeon]
MKKYPKIVQCDNRGQIVIPKEVRKYLEINEGTGFFMFTINEEGILLKKIENNSINEKDNIIKEIIENKEKIGIKNENITKTIENYKPEKETILQEI